MLVDTHCFSWLSHISSSTDAPVCLAVDRDSPVRFKGPVRSAPSVVAAVLQAVCSVSCLNSGVRRSGKPHVEFADPWVTVSSQHLVFDAVSPGAEVVIQVSLDLDDPSLGSLEYGTARLEVSALLEQSLHLLTQQTCSSLYLSAHPPSQGTAQNVAAHHREHSISSEWIRAFLILQSSGLLPSAQVELPVGGVLSLLPYAKLRLPTSVQSVLRVSRLPNGTSSIRLLPWDHELVSLGDAAHPVQGDLGSSMPRLVETAYWRAISVLAPLLRLAPDVSLRIRSGSVPLTLSVNLPGVAVSCAILGTMAGSSLGMPIAYDDHIAHSPESTILRARFSQHVPLDVDQASSCLGGTKDRALSVLQQLVLAGQCAYLSCRNVFYRRVLFPSVSDLGRFLVPRPEVLAAQVMSDNQNNSFDSWSLATRRIARIPFPDSVRPVELTDDSTEFVGQIQEVGRVHVVASVLGDIEFAHCDCGRSLGRDSVHAACEHMLAALLHSDRYRESSQPE